jgi:DNA-binding NarL/FixJ family response regulator
MEVVIQASGMPDLLEKLKSYAVEIVLMDLFMPGLHGSDAVKSVHSEYPHIKILVLSMSNDLDLISELLDSGIHGYISKADEPDELVKAIQVVSEDRIYHNKIFTEALYRNKQNKIRTYTEGGIVLNEREKRVIQLLWEEKSNKEIGDELFLGVRSVEKIRQDIKEKIGAKSTVGLLKYAISKKIIGATTPFTPV